jgi:AcrR family transcriptional regulator
MSRTKTLEKPAVAVEAPTKRAAERIGEMARELFYSQGIRAVGVDEIVTRAGVTKPSLYRAYASKDELAAAYLRGYDGEFWARFDQPAIPHPDDARAQLLAWLDVLAQRATQAGYRGCGLTNAAVEYPEAGHPARVVAEANKAELRRRLRELAGRMGARDADALGDGLLLLVEGAYASGQLFGEGGPAGVIVQAAVALIDVQTADKAPAPKPPASKPAAPRKPQADEQPSLF